jgi:hypothetical protein
MHIKNFGTLIVLRLAINKENKTNNKNNNHEKENFIYVHCSHLNHIMVVQQGR